MKFQPDTLAGVNMISRHDASGIRVGADLFGHSVIVPWVGAVQPWPVADFDALTAQAIEQALALGPEVLVLGTGPRLRFPAPAVLAPAIARRIGVESMDVAAACRTYNVLVSEGRKVVAALLIAPSA